MLFRLNEGKGKALYIIGIDDDGTVDGIPISYIMESYHYLLQMCDIINATLNTFKVYKGINNLLPLVVFQLITMMNTIVNLIVFNF